MQNTIIFRSSHSNKVYHIKKTFTVILKWWFREKFRARAQTSNFSTRTKSAKPNVQPEQFHKHYLQSDHNVIFDWEITIIDHAETEKPLSSKELCWYHKSKKYAP